MQSVSFFSSVDKKKCQLRKHNYARRAVGRLTARAVDLGIRVFHEKQFGTEGQIRGRFVCIDRMQTKDQDPNFPKETGVMYPGYRGHSRPNPCKNLGQHNL